MSIMSTVSEKRKHRRLNLELAVEFAPDGIHDALAPKCGTTRNVSAGGIYFETSMGGTVRQGAEIFLKIAVPQPKGCSAESFALRCEGHVVRIDKLVRRKPEQECLGIAVQFKNKPNVEFHSLNSLLWELGK